MTQRMRRTAGRAMTVVTAVALVTAALVAPAQAGAPASKAPILAGKGETIPGQYIVVLNDGVSARGLDVAASNGVPTVQNYTGAFRGFAAKLTPAQLAKVSQDPSVKYIEPDAYVHATAEVPDPPDTGGITANAVQTGATWGIDRIDQRKGLNGKYIYTGNGTGVTAYVLDTGILTTHQQFGTRARYGYDVIGGAGSGGDCHGHGTHVAGTIAGSTVGVAKGAQLVAVRVLNCGGSGTVSGVIAGIDWVTVNRSGPSVANLSLGGGYTQALNDAVAASIASGITYIVAAGNDNANACNASPASTPSAITIGATDRNDVRAWFSNYGSCLDLFEPGVDIVSAARTSNSALATLSGTSMAAPHAAGLAALYLQINPAAKPAAVAQVLVTMSAAGVVTDTQGSTNRLGRKWVGSLSGPGASMYLPDNASWTQVRNGTAQAWLAGQGGRNVDLFLERWDGTKWVKVGQSTSSGSREKLYYPVTVGSKYRYRIYQVSGAATTIDLWALR